MSTKALFTVWSARRTKKTIVLVDKDDPQLYEKVILKASEKLDVNGSSLVLESNGTPIDDEILPHVQSEILLLLDKNELWSPNRKEAQLSYSNSSLPSTVTYVPSSDEASGVGNPNCEKRQDIEISYVVNCNSEHHWSSIEVPWNKLSLDQIEELNNGIKSRVTISALIHATINEMRCVKHIIPTKAFKIVAKKIIDKYPRIFQDVDEDGIVLGDGSHSLVCKLQDRNNYLNRPHKRKLNENTSENTPNPVKIQKRYMTARAGCPNWCPDPEKARTVGTKPDMTINESHENFYEMLEATYSEQRSFINGIPTVLEVKEKWPILLSKHAIFWHFNKLTNSDIHLIDGIMEKKEKFNRFLIEKLKENAENKDITLRDILTKLALYYKEDVKKLYTVFQSLDEVKLDDIPVTPCIVEIDAEESVPIHYIYLEKEQINMEGYEKFEDAFKICFALYFVFNLHYPREISTVMELVQRMFLKIHPDAGSKSKKVTPTKKKVFNFMNKFKNYT